MHKDKEINRLLTQISENKKKITTLEWRREKLMEQYNANTVKIEKMKQMVEETMRVNTNANDRFY